MGKDKNLTDLDYQYLNASQEQVLKAQQKRANKWMIFFYISLVVALGTVGIRYWWKATYCSIGQVRLGDNCVLAYSSGESIFFRDQGNFDQDQGIAAFKTGNYQQAINYFDKAVTSASNDPEPQIYLNNAIARQRGNSFKLAVVVPAYNDASSAKGILRGVADAQTKFNKKQNGRLLEIVIANDGNEPEVSAKVAQQLVEDKDILGVIGHDSSQASIAALPIYEKAELAMISPTSTSTELSSPVFFRTVPSDAETGKILAQYAKEISLDKVIIFYEKDNSYSESIKQAFEKQFVSQQKGKVIKTLELKDSQFNAKDSLNQDGKNTGVKAAVLFPSTKTISVVIPIAKANAQLSPKQRLTLLGGDALYNSYTLVQGRAAVEGMVLVVPWADNTRYSEDAENTWKGQINWLTARSYDATQAFIQALDNGGNSRKTVLNNLRSIDLPQNETSGIDSNFWATGDPDRAPRLVKVVKGGASPDDVGWSFEKIDFSAKDNNN